MNFSLAAFIVAVWGMYGAYNIYRRRLRKGQIWIYCVDIDIIQVNTVLEVIGGKVKFKSVVLNPKINYETERECQKFYFKTGAIRIQ